MLKQATLDKMALMGKTRFVADIGKGLSYLLKNTVYIPGRQAFIQGAKDYGGRHVLTRAGRFLRQSAYKLPVQDSLKKYLTKFPERLGRPIDWNAGKGLDRIKKSIYSREGNLGQMLDRLSRRTMWTPEYKTTYTDHPVDKALDWLSQHLAQLGHAQRAKKDPNYDPMAYAIQKLREAAKH